MVGQPMRIVFSAFRQKDGELTGRAPGARSKRDGTLGCGDQDLSFPPDFLPTVPTGVTRVSESLAPFDAGNGLATHPVS
jgi:hypothetical protein